MWDDDPIGTAILECVYDRVQAEQITGRSYALRNEPCETKDGGAKVRKGSSEVASFEITDAKEDVCLMNLRESSP